MKNKRNVIWLLAALVTFSLVVSGYRFYVKSYQDVSQVAKINEVLDRNLGLLKDEISDLKRVSLYFLYALELPLNERRIENNHLYPGPFDTLVTKLINNQLDAATKRYLFTDEMRVDRLGYDPYHNYEDKTLRKLKDYLSDEDYRAMIFLIQSEHVGNPAAIDEMKLILKQYDFLKTDVIISYLTDYRARTHNARYEVNEDLTLTFYPFDVLTPKLLEAPLDTYYQQIWRDIKQILPHEVIGMVDVVQFVVDQEDAKVIPILVQQPTGKQFRLTIDTMDYEMLTYLRPFYESILHQYFHYVVYSESQGIFSSHYNSDVYFEKGFISNDTSYLNEYYQLFWKDLINDRLINQLAFHFYERHKDDFITPYASTNPVEDISESFVHFVLDDKPKGSLIKDKKIQFFYNYDNLVTLRTEIRHKLFD
ncbi:MAG: hypothetical protein ACRCST_13195 [Turicibacter sp.]